MRRGIQRGSGPPGYPLGSRSPEGFKDVLREVWLSPVKFFGRLDPEGGLVRPALFATTILYLNLIFDELLREVWRLEFNYGFLYAVLPGLVVSLILAPLLIAGLSALVLTVLDGAPSRRKFGPVFRALSYATAIAVVLWIPFAPLFALPYGLYVATVAVKEVLFLRWSRAVVATLAPLGAVLLILLLLAGFDEAYRLLINPPGG